MTNTLSPEEYILAGGGAGFLLDANPEAATVRGADVAVNRRSDVGEDLPYGWFPGAPMLAVEVVSPGRTVYVYSAGRRDPQVFEEGDTFHSVLDKTFRVEDLFRV